ncbi:MAG: ATP-dependent endonuclease [Flavobacteriales bacterium]|nr:ATP-dependent endonuclease [Flavobacteriales bacterium]|tara:strand:- start:897 stop:2288 length:1392 start_codon:yes stop_codon:yes gene_type:complete
MQPYNLYKSLVTNFEYEPTADQKSAFKLLSSFIFDNNIKIFLLKGFAGTGKTTIMKTLIENLDQINIKFSLMAPTGRAAKVLSTYTKKKAYTIHRKIYYTKFDSTGVFKPRLKKNKNKNVLFIIDEASLISDNDSQKELFSTESLMNDIINHIDFKTNSKLIFLGDSAQLPPVKLSLSPALNKDFLLDKFKVDIDQIEMSNVVRQSNESGILNNATTIRNKIFKNEFDFIFTESKDVINLNDGFEVQDSIQSSYDEFGMSNTIIIVRSNKRANLYNEQIRKMILSKNHKVCVGDNLMITKNNYFWLQSDSEIPFLANGDIIEVIEIYSFIEIYGFEFAKVKVKMLDYENSKFFDTILILNSLDSETPSLNYEQNRNLYTQVSKDYENVKSKYIKYKKTKENPYLNALNIKFSYSITCHKAQGGQWPVVFIEKPYLKDGINNDYLRWLYTAVTRAENKVYLIGF